LDAKMALACVPCSRIDDDDSATDSGPTRENGLCMPELRTYWWVLEDFWRSRRPALRLALPHAGLVAVVCWRRGDGRAWLEIQNLEVRSEWRRRGVATQYFRVLAEAVGSHGSTVRVHVPEGNAEFAGWTDSLVTAGHAVRRTVHSARGGAAHGSRCDFVESTWRPS